MARNIMADLGSRLYLGSTVAEHSIHNHKIPTTGTRREKMARNIMADLGSAFVAQW